MKNVNKLKLIVLMAIGILIYSCQDEFNENTELTEPVSEIDTSKLIDFKGLKVNHRFSTPVNELENKLNFSSESIASRYNRISKAIHSAKNGVANKNSNTLLKEDDEIDEKVILEAKDRVIHLFPYQKTDERDFELPILETLDSTSLTEEEIIALENRRKLDSIALVNYENDYLEQQAQQANTNFEMIRQDFPTLTEAQIKEHIEVIDNYYQQNLDYVVLEDIAENVGLLADKTSIVKTTTNAKGPVVTTIIISTAIVGIWGLVNYYAAKRSAREAETAARKYFGTAGGGNDRADAFTHITLNVFLAKNYIGIIPIKSIKTAFAKFASDYHENNGNNAVDSKEMDFHNNAIGRQIYKDNTTHSIFYISEPSHARIESIVLNYVNKKSCFLRKTIKDEQANRDYSETEIQTQIRNTHDNTVVYFKGKIAPPSYVPIGFEYSSCDLLSDVMDEQGIDDEAEALNYIREYYNLYRYSDFQVYNYIVANSNGNCARKVYKKVEACSTNN